MFGVEENFEKEGNRDNLKAWPRLSKSRIRQRVEEGKLGKILQVSGRLASSITSKVTNRDAIVGTNVKYAAAHEFGVTTKPHVIKAKRKKSLRFLGSNGKAVFRKKVNHPGSKIPQRSFLSLSEKDIAKARNAAANHLIRDV